MRIIESLGAAARETALCTICAHTFPERVGFIVVSIISYNARIKFRAQLQLFNKPFIKLIITGMF